MARSYGKLRSLTPERLQEIANTCSSVRQVVLVLEMRGGSSYAAIKELLKTFKTNTSHFTGMTWNKGLTKADHPAIASAGRQTRERMLGKPGAKHSEDAKARISKKRIEYLESHPNHGLRWYEVACGEGVCKVQGTWEKHVAEWLNANGVKWSRKRLTFKGHRRYTPDFYLEEQDVFIEVKGFWRDRDVYKMFLVLDENDVDVRYVDKTNIKNLTLDLPKFVDRFRREDIDETKFKNVWNA